MRLRNELILSQARLLGCTMVPTDEDPIITLALRAGLTSDVAEAFGCRDLIFAGNVPRSGVDKMTLEGDEIDCEVRFAHDSIAFNVVASSVGHYVARLESEGPTLAFRVKMKGYADSAAALISAVKADPLEITLKPAQLPLELHEEVVASPEDEERVISPEQAQDTAETTDADFAPLQEREAPLAQATVMGGTHQAKRGRGRPRKLEVVAADPEPEVEPDFLSEIVQ